MARKNSISICLSIYFVICSCSIDCDSNDEINNTVDNDNLENIVVQKVSNILLKISIFM